MQTKPNYETRDVEWAAKTFTLAQMQRIDFAGLAPAWSDHRVPGMRPYHYAGETLR